MVRVHGLPIPQAPPSVELWSGVESLPASLCLELHRVMVRSRLMEERMIKMSKSGEGYFWIGGPGEEAFNACLGLQVKKGQGPDFDYLYLHYRNSATLVAMGMPLIDGLRQMAMTRTDPHSMGRCFPGHYAYRSLNVLPVSSVIGNQFAMAPGTALVQKRRGNDAVTIAIGGEAGTAEGDFASGLIWSTRPGNEVPVLFIVMNNGWGISTPASTQHGEQHVIERGRAFNIPGEVVDGNDPVASWHAVQRGLEYCRHRRRPYMIEATVSRLYGHSSSSGCQRARDEIDCLRRFEHRLQAVGLLDQELIRRIHGSAQAEVEEAVEQLHREARPEPEDVSLHTFAPSPVDVVYPDDYRDLPGR
ncbi:MAG: thiamine pyrophosphate-dependent dehydrogenase E1 component subunit alpha [Gemmataceae bacterium]